MRGNELLDNMELVDAAYVEAADAKPRRRTWTRWTAVAACFAALVIAGTAIIPSFLGGSNGRYKDVHIQAGEAGILWPWEYLTVYEKYTEIEIDGIEYRNRGRAVSEALLGQRIGTYTVVGYDHITNEKHTADFEAYQLRDVAQSEFVAVKMDGAYYVFKNDEYDPPSTLGELLEAVNLPKVLELGHFSENGVGPSKNHFELNDDDYVWEILSGCQSAAFVEDQKWNASSRDYLSFTITSETLGVYRVAMYVTADGYLWTNAFGWQYLFDIGEEVAGKIMQYAKENSTEAAYEPYRNTVAGKIVEMTDAYILIDDSILCKDPADGITYKIMLNDMRISRYVDHGIVTVGDTVQISYEGEIDTQNGNTIDSAISASQAVISGGDVSIPE